MSRNELTGEMLKATRKTDRKRWAAVVRKAVKLSADRTQAAARLGVSVATLQRWMHEPELAS